MRRFIVALVALLGALILGMPPASALTTPTLTLFTTNDAGPSGNTGISVQGEPVFLVLDIATVAGIAATGLVTFSDNGAQIGQVNAANGIAVFAHIAASGIHVYGASYTGDSRYSAGTANNVNQSVGGNCAAATGQVLFPGPVIFRGGTWFLRTLLGPGLAAHCFNWGFPGALPVMGDWDGNGTKTIGLFFNGTWYLSNNNTPGPVDIKFTWGGGGQLPVVGDWDGDGTDTIGVYQNGTWFLRNTNSSGGVDARFDWGGPGMQPVVGDWDGNRTDTPGLFLNGAWFLRNSNSSGPVDARFDWGDAGMTPLSGDWNGDGIDSIGVFVGGNWYVRNSNSSGGVDGVWPWGSAGDLPVTGR